MLNPNEDAKDDKRSVIEILDEGTSFLISLQYDPIVGHMKFECSRIIIGTRNLRFLACVGQCLPFGLALAIYLENARPSGSHVSRCQELAPNRHEARRAEGKGMPEGHPRGPEGSEF